MRARSETNRHRLDRRLPAQPSDLGRGAAEYSGQHLCPDRPADTALAVAHADPGEGLGAVHVRRRAGRRFRGGIAQLAGGDRLATAEDGAIRHSGGNRCREREGAFQGSAEAGPASQRAIGLRDLHGIGPAAGVFQQCQRGACTLPDFHPADPGTVAGRIDPQLRGAPGRVAARHPIVSQRVEIEGQADQAGKLRFGPQLKPTASHSVRCSSPLTARQRSATTSASPLSIASGTTLSTMGIGCVHSQAV